MSHAARLISNLVFLSAALTLSSCAMLKPQPESSAIRKSTPQRIYYASYDQVWRAAHTVMKYTIANENQETGFLETEYIKGVDGWLPPENDKKPSAGLRYKFVLSFAKGKTDGRESTRVTMDKRIEVLRDFFSEPENLQSDGLEEKILFYRIERELLLSEALKKASTE